MSDKKISQLPSATDLSPDGIVPISQIDPMDGILKTFGVTADKFSHGFFTFPNDTMYPVMPGDVGKLAMNDGSGTAKVYALSSPVASQAGKWQVQLNSSNWVGIDLSSINLDKVDNTSYFLDRNSWTGGVAPVSPALELTQIKTAIDALGTGLTTSISGDILTIEELPGYIGWRIAFNKISPGIFTVLKRSLPPCPAAPTAFPLGKIVGVKGADVLISSEYVETYTLSSPIIVDNSNLDTLDYHSFDFSNSSTVLHLAKSLATPDSGGTVAPLDLSVYHLDSSLGYAMRHQIVGLIIKADGTTATVLNLGAASPIFNLVIKIMYSGNN